MALAVQGQTSGQLLVTLSDVSMMNSLKKAISLLKGVETVKPVRQHRLSAIEKSMQEVENGELYEAKNLDELFLIENIEEKRTYKSSLCLKQMYQHQK